MGGWQSCEACPPCNGQVPGQQGQTSRTDPKRNSINSRNKLSQNTFQQHKNIQKQLQSTGQHPINNIPKNAQLTDQQSRNNPPKQTQNTVQQSRNNPPKQARNAVQQSRNMNTPRKKKSIIEEAMESQEGKMVTNAAKAQIGKYKGVMKNSFNKFKGKATSKLTSGIMKGLSGLLKKIPK